LIDYNNKVERQAKVKVVSPLPGQRTCSHPRTSPFVRII